MGLLTLLRSAHWGQAQLSTSGTVSAAAVRVVFANAAVDVAGTVTGTPVRVVFASTALQVAGTVTGAPVRVVFASTAVEVTGTVSAAVVRVVLASTTMQGAGTVSAAVVRVVFASTAVQVASTVTGAARMTIPGGAAIFSARTSLRLTPVIIGREYRILVTNRTGWPYAELENARLDGITWELNGPGTCDFVIGTEDPKAAQILTGREIQVWRGDQVIFWGPIVRPQSTPAETQVQCAGLLWYLTRRHLGKADRDNMVKNGDFEDGEANWTFVGAVGHSIKRRGGGPPQPLSSDKMLKLTGTSTGHDSFARQRWTHHQSHPLGDLITVACYVYVPSGTFTHMALDGRGLFVQVESATEETAPGVKRLTQTPNAPIDLASITLDEWVPLEVEVFNVKKGDVIEVRLYPPHGDAYYDLVVGVYMESLAFHLNPSDPNDTGVDQAMIAGDLVLYAQSRPTRTAQWFNHGKSDLYIDVLTPLTGLTFSVAYQFAEHQNVMDAIAEYMSGELGIDVDIEYGPTKRTFITYFPYKGVYRPDLALEYGRNIAEFSVSYDGEMAATDVVVLGHGEGPDRPEGGARDLVGLDGLTLEKVVSPTESTTPGSVDDIAREELRISRDPTIVELTTYEGAGPLVGRLKTGDFVPIRVRHGRVDVDGIYRIVGLSLTPETETMNVTLNPITTADLLRAVPELSPEAAMARTPNATDACRRPAGGVWVVASDGGVFSWGGAPFYGSMGGKPLNAPMVAIVPHGSTGYWIVGADTGIFAFGSAPARGPYQPMVDTEYAAGDRAIIAAEASGANGLILLADEGSTYDFP